MKEGDRREKKKKNKYFEETEFWKTKREKWPQKLQGKWLFWSIWEAKKYTKTQNNQPNPQKSKARVRWATEQSQQEQEHKKKTTTIITTKISNNYKRTTLTTNYQQRQQKPQQQINNKTTKQN